jgi:hypothetical protein
MPADNPKRSIHKQLVDRILHGPGHAPADQRAQAFANAALPRSGAAVARQGRHPVR